jgi:signal transduction histidine kinase
MGKRTWPVFLVGFGSLLALLFLPGLTALDRTRRVYQQIRAIQQAYQRSQRSLDAIERRVYQTSILVREFLLDTSPVNGPRYQHQFVEGRQAIEAGLSELKQSAHGADQGATRRLEAELALYWESVAPVFHWNPEERAERATYFLREQHRPRRQSILAIADEIDALNTRAYREQYERLNDSQRVFGQDLERSIALAFFIGVLIAAGSTLRISSLERRAERHRIKTELAEEQLRSLSTQLMHAQEEERKTLSRELHDEVGQMLTGLRMELGSLERLRDQPDQFREHSAEAKAIAEQTLRAVRDLAVGLRPSVLDLGLAPALQWQARHFTKRTGIRVNLNLEGSFEGVPEAQRMCIYRVVQETLTNSARHSEARNIDVHLRDSASALDVRVQDDGRGFQPLITRHGGLGLIGMEERVRELGGKLQIESQPGGGTLISVHLPVRRESAA